ncbi:MAG TPA: hypothetical protein VJQ58_11615 [Burkholderiales bacterium]|nr:hypothetical protein [Burkholderiales bacterium]
MKHIATVCTAALLAFGASIAAGADILEDDSIWLCDAKRQPSSRLTPSQLWLQLDPLVKEGKVNAVYLKLADIAEGAVDGAPGAGRVLTLLRFPDNRPFDVAPDGTTEKIFRAAPNDTITIDCLAPVTQPTIDLVTVALAAEWMRTKHEIPLLGARARSVKKAARDAEDLLKNGLAMWPWELWLNGLRLSKTDSDPLFRTQWVFMRPTAGIEIDTYSQASADLQASVALEPLGFVRYRGEGYSHWWGASLVLTASTRRGAGYGALFRWDNYVLGVTRHKGQGSEPDSNFLLIGVDLHDLLNKKRAELKDWDGFAALLK